MAWTEDRRVVALRRRWRLVDLVVEILDGWRLHFMGRNAAVLTYYGFLSIFPLFMVGTTVLGFVLEDNPELVDDILDTAVSQIPVIGQQIRAQAGSLGGSGLTIVVGLLIAMWAATRAFVGLQVAIEDAWETPIDRRDNLAMKRGKAALGVMVLGGGLVSATVLTSFASIGDFALVNRILLLSGTVVVNGGVLLVMYKILSARRRPWSVLVPGAVLGGVAFTALQAVGATLVDRFIRSASDTAGVFASVFALMAWINLHATISLVGAELNAALVRRRARAYAAPIGANWGDRAPERSDVQPSGEVE